MKILHVVTNSDLGGAPRVVTELSYRAIRDGESCAVAAMAGGPMWKHLDSEVEQFPVPSMRRDVNLREDFKTFKFLRSLFCTYAPDIIHLHSSKAGTLGRLAALSLGPGWVDKCIYTIHGFDTILKTHKRYLPLERFLAFLGGIVVAVSEYDEINLRKVGIQKNLAKVLNGATDRHGEVSADFIIRKRIESERAHGRKVVLSIARLEKPKRPDLFVQLAKSLPEVAFFWVGNVRSPQDFGLVDTELVPNLSFLGESPEAGSLVNLCDLFMLLSDYEGIPMSVLEAMSCGKPVIASNVGGIPEALGRDGDRGGILVPNDIGSIRKAAEEVLLNSDKEKIYGLIGMRRFQEGFTADHMWGQYLKLYRNILASYHR